MDMGKVRKLMKEFNNNINLYERPEYKITERNKKSYILHSILLEYGDGALYFGDDDNILLENNSILNEVLYGSIKDIIVLNKKYTIELAEELGQVEIELVR